jgi:hypothetical protein
MRKKLIKWWDRVVAKGGHRTVTLLGRKVTIYAFGTAMHGAVNVRTRRWGVLCFAWPALGGMERFAPYVYLSPNATPWASTFVIGKGAELDRRERRMVAVRRALWGHGYDCTRLDPQVLDRAVWAAEDRSPEAVASLDHIVRDRASWLAEEASA